MDQEVDENKQAQIEELEQALCTTMREFSVYVGSITADLEKKEERRNVKRQKAGRNPKWKWRGSTLKIDLVRGLMFKLFPPTRLMKYNVIRFLPMKRWIVARHEDFFLKGDIFAGADDEDIQFFRDLWSIEGTMTEKEKEMIWSFWDTQMEIVEDWQYLTGWEVNHNEGLFIPDIDYDAEARKIGIDV